MTIEKLKSICNFLDNDKTCFMGYNQCIYSVKLLMSISYEIRSLMNKRFKNYCSSRLSSLIPSEAPF